MVHELLIAPTDFNISHEYSWIIIDRISTESMVERALNTTKH